MGHYQGEILTRKVQWIPNIYREKEVTNSIVPTTGGESMSIAAVLALLAVTLVVGPWLLLRWLSATPRRGTPHG
ncbi:hypothetical protein SAMN04487820_110188 [Actinopolyspora mzabensis]|uniref:Uncharacterized protein n=1 Tax=Actinopolyspora mzabensis TaxID=995066 RepID=A0A1G9DMK5_ACTMZ|nr:hypothetical protein SAMN04487820_110188 [Actinopolyspora mzabensis]